LPCAGATFTVRSYAHATLTFTIANVRRIEAAGHAGQTHHEGYRIESGGDSACLPEVAARVRYGLGLTEHATPPKMPTAPGHAFGRDDDLVIAMGEPLYDRRDERIADLPGSWFNLACAGDALAKLRLYGLHRAKDDAANETGLRMITANYCGKPYTMRGMEFGWITSPKDRLITEAQWSGGKAICVDTPRLMGSAGVPASQLPIELQPMGCQDGGCDREGWISRLRAECALPACGEIEEPRASSFSSYLVEDEVRFGRDEK
jgi:hypothetical protein